MQNDTFTKEQLFRFGQFVKKHPDLTVYEIYLKWKKENESLKPIK